MPSGPALFSTMDNVENFQSAKLLSKPIFDDGSNVLLTIEPSIKTMLHNMAANTISTWTDGTAAAVTAQTFGIHNNIYQTEFDNPSFALVTTFDPTAANPADATHTATLGTINDPEEDLDKITAIVPAETAPYYDMAIKFTFSDGLSDGDISGGDYVVTMDDDDSNYNAQKAVNSSLSRTGTSNAGIAVSEPDFNDDSLLYEGRIAQDATTGALTLTSGYTGGATSFATDDYTIELDTTSGLVPDFGIFRFTQPEPVVDIVLAEDATTTDDLPIMRSTVAEANPPFGAETVTNLPGSLTNSELAALFDPDPVVYGFDFSIAGIDNDGGYSSEDAAFTLDNSALVDNSVYMKAGALAANFASSIHTLEITNGSLTASFPDEVGATPSNTLNSAFFSIVDGPESLTAISDGFVRMYFSNPAFLSSDFVYGRSTQDVASDFMPDFRVTYHASEGFPAGVISTIDRENYASSYKVDVLLPSTNDADTTFLTALDVSGSAAAINARQYSASNITKNNDTAFIAFGTVGADLTEISCTSSYVTPDDNYFAIFDFTSYINFAESSVLYGPNTGDIIPGALVSVRGSNIDVTDLTGGDVLLRTSIAPRPVTALTLFTDGWTRAHTSGTFMTVQKGPHNIFDGDAYAIAALPSTTTLSLVIAVGHTATALNVDYLENWITMSYSNIGGLGLSGSYTANSLTKVDVGALSSSFVAVSSEDEDYSGIPANTELRIFTDAIVFSLRTAFPFATYQNLSITSPPLTQTDVYYKLYDTLRDAYLPDSYLRDITYLGNALLATRDLAAVSESHNLTMNWGFNSSDMFSHNGYVERSTTGGSSWLFITDVQFVDSSFDNVTTLTESAEGANGTVEVSIDIANLYLLEAANLYIDMSTAPDAENQTLVTGRLFDSADVISSNGVAAFGSSFNLYSTATPTTLDGSAFGTNIPCTTSVEVTSLGGGQYSTTITIYDATPAAIFTIEHSNNISQSMRIIYSPTPVLAITHSYGDDITIPIVNSVDYTGANPAAASGFTKLAEGIEVSMANYVTGRLIAGGAGDTSTWELSGDRVNVQFYTGSTTGISELTPTFAPDRLLAGGSARDLQFAGYRGIVPFENETNPNYDNAVLTRTSSSALFRVVNTPTSGVYTNQHTFGNFAAGTAVTVDTLANTGTASATKPDLGDIGLGITFVYSMLSGSDTTSKPITLAFDTYTVTYNDVTGSAISAAAYEIYRNDNFAVVSSRIRNPYAGEDLFAITYDVPAATIARADKQGAGTKFGTGDAELALSGAWVTYQTVTHAALTAEGGVLISYDYGVGTGGVRGIVNITRGTEPVTGKVKYWQSARPQLSVDMISTDDVSAVPYASGSVTATNRWVDIGALVSGVDTQNVALNPFSGASGCNDTTFEYEGDRVYLDYRADRAALVRFDIASNEVLIETYYGFATGGPPLNTPPAGTAVEIYADGKLSAMSGLPGTYTDNEVAYSRATTYTASTDSYKVEFAQTTQPLGSGSFDDENMNIVLTIGSSFMNGTFYLNADAGFSTKLTTYGASMAFDEDTSVTTMNLYKYTMASNINLNALPFTTLRSLNIIGNARYIHQITIPPQDFGSTPLNYATAVSSALTAAAAANADIAWTLDADFVSGSVVKVFFTALTLTGLENRLLLAVTEEDQMRILMFENKDIFKLSGQDGVPVLRILNNGIIQTTSGFVGSSVTLQTQTAAQGYMNAANMLNANSNNA